MSTARLPCVIARQTSAEVGERRVRKAAAHLVRVLRPLRGTPRRRTAFAALSVDSGDADDEWKRGSALCGGKERVLEGFGPPGVLFLALRRTTGARARRGSSLERHRFSGFEPKIRTKIRRYGRRYENPNHHREAHLILEPFVAGYGRSTPTYPHELLTHANQHNEPGDSEAPLGQHASGTTTSANVRAGA